MKNVLLSILIVFGVTGALIFLLFLAQKSQSTVSGVLKNPVNETDWARGASSAQVTLVEYSDFQCPACQAYEPLVQKLTGRYGEKIRLVYRYFPLSQHRNANAAAQAAEAAGRQGKFWQMHDVLFAKHTEWEEASAPEVLFVGYAQMLGLNIEKFKTDMHTENVQKKINDDYASGEASSVTGTPTFFLNGNKIDNPTSYEQFQSVIEQAIAKNS